MSKAQLIIVSLASVIGLLIWLVIGLLEKKQRRSQARDLKFTDEVEQDSPFSP